MREPKSTLRQRSGGRLDRSLWFGVHVIALLIEGAGADIAKMLGGSRATVYRYLSEGVSLSAERLGPAVG
jgi:hypothetical protein